MKNTTWRRIGYITLLIIAGLVGYGIACSICAMDTAKWFISKAVDLGIIEGVGKAELMEYFIKLKGGA